MASPKQDRETACGKTKAIADQISPIDRDALAQTAGSIAHDLNNALTGILGRAQLALGQSKDEKITRHLRLIERSALDAAEVVLRLQELARSLRNTFPADKEPKHK